MVTHPPLSIARLTMVAEPDDPSTTSLCTGPAIRGAFGNRLRRMSCVTRAPSCAGCGLTSHCAYGRIFETRNTGAAQRLRGAPHAPHPFVLKLPRVADGRLLLIWTLVGRAIDDLPVVLVALDALARGFTVGLEERRPRTARFRTHEVFARDADGCDYPLASGSSWPGSRRLGITLADLEGEASGHRHVRLEFVSPMHLIENGAPIERFDWGVFLRRLCTRIEVMSACYCGGGRTDGWFDAVAAAASGVAVAFDDTRWAAAGRFSSRHRKDLPLGGFLGQVVLQGNVDSLLPVIRAGEALGVGKNTSSGCGEYELRMPEEGGR